MEDNDVKIFNAGNKTEHRDTTDLDIIVLAEELKRNMANGNAAKAKELGKLLAGMTPDSDDLNDELKAILADRSVTNDIKLQLRILMVFAAEHTLFRLLPPLVAATASDALYDKLRRDEYEFYETVSGGTSFTFYYLAVKKDDANKAIGESFAMLCNADNNAVIRYLGQQTFALMCAQIESMIEERSFEK